MPELRDARGDQLRDRVCLGGAVFDFDERAHEAVRERAVGELVGVALGREAGLNADPGL